MKTLSGNDVKKMILAAIPELSYKDVSVIFKDRIAYYIKIKKVVANSKVKDVVNELVSVDRCEITGEILSGGNTYVFVEYSDSIVITDDIIEIFEKAIIEIVKYSDDSFMDKQQKLARNISLNEMFSEYTSADIYKLIYSVSKQFYDVQEWLTN